MVASIDLGLKVHDNIKGDALLSYAPILVFIYNRPHHLEKTLSSLIACDGFENHQVIVVGDGRKPTPVVDLGGVLKGETSARGWCVVSRRDRLVTSDPARRSTEPGRERGARR